MKHKKRFRKAIGAFACWLLSSTFFLYGQVSTGGTSTTSNHNKEVIGYITQWDAWKGTSAGLPAQGALNQLNIDYSKYTILNFSFFGVANDGSLHSGDLRNKNIYMEGEVQEPGDIFYTDIYSSWDLYILFGQLDIIQYISSDIATRAAEQGFEVEVNGTTWSNPTWGLYDKDLPLPLKTEGGAGGLLELAHANGVKVMASIGGWSMCKHFPEMAADAEKRARFIEDCKTLINVGFDGIDIDWEYPGFGGMNFTGSDADFTNFTILMQEIREAIGEDKLLTAAMSAAPSKLEGFEWDKLTEVMDYFNMMTYDFNGGWSDIAGHNSPLYEYDGAETPEFNWNSTFTKLQDLGVPTSMINMGCPFYGRGVVCESTAGLNAATTKTSVTIQPDGPISTCADYVNWPLNVYDGTPNYFYIKNQTGLGTTNGWTRYWDNQAKVPFLTNGKYFLSYDDEESVTEKAQYIVNNDLAGTIIWTVFGDLEISGTETSFGTKLKRWSDVSSNLVNTINDVFANGSDSDPTAPSVSISSPSSGASYEENSSITITATASDTDGSVSQVEFFYNGTSLGTDETSPYSVTWNNVTAGTYALTAVATDNSNLSSTSNQISIVVTEIGTETNGLRIVGYMPSWQGSADDIQYDKLTHIIYAFATPNSSGDGSIDAIPESSKLQSIVELAHAQNVKVLIAVGGWTDLNNPGFEGICSSETGRTNFAANLLNICNTYNLDGIDIDWEYPIGYTSEYTLMMQTLSSTLHAEGKILTAAVPGGSYYGQYVNLEALDAMDFLNVMAYDGDNGSGHSPYSYAVSALDYWTGKGMENNKAVLGVPFYSRPSEITYANLLAQGADPYEDYFNGDYYNGITTIKQKSELAKSYGGIMIWEISQDASGEYSLLSAIYEELYGSATLKAYVGGTYSGSINTSVTFTGSASGGTSPYTYTWNFGDGSTGTGSTSTHSYTTAGSYTITLTVTDSEGSTASATTTATIEESGDDDDDDSGSTCWTKWVAGAYTGGAQVSYNGVNYQAKWWTDGTPGVDDTWENMGACDGSGSDDDDSGSTCWTEWVAGAYTGGAQVSYNGVNYQAKWWTNSTPGVDDTWENMGTCGTTTTTLSVSTESSYSGITNESISFNGSASGGVSPYTYLWNFGDGSTSSVINPEYSYSASGTYTATLTVTDSENSSSSTQVTVTITEQPVIPVSPSGFTASAQSNSKINLSWTDNSDNETSFLVQYSTNGSTFSDLASVSSNTTSYTHSGLSASTTYYYRVAAVNSAGTSDYSSVVNATTSTSDDSGDLPATIMSGYWHTWSSGAPFIKLRDVDTHWDVINIAFAEPVTPGSTDGSMQFEISGLTSDYTIDDFKTDVSDLQANGKKIVLSIGGYEGYFSLTSSAAASNFATAIKSYINEYGFDGIDIDLEQYSIEFNSGADQDFENPVSPKIVYLIEALNQIVDSYDSDFILSFAPETFYFQLGYNYYGGLNGYVDTRAGVYIPVIHALRDRVTYVQTQLYNSGSIKGLDGNWYDMGTVAGIMEMCEMAIEGFPLNGNTSYNFPGLRPDQVVIGVPSSQSAAGSGQISNENLQTAFTVVNAQYPGLRGIMSWSINWDAYQNDNSFVTENRDYLDGIKSTEYLSSVTKLEGSGLTLYPNPANTSLYINGNIELLRIEIFNSIGIKVLETTNQPIDISWLKSGTYILKASDDSQTQQKIFIKN